MSDSFLTLARTLFKQKFQELLRIRDEYKRDGEISSADAKKLQEYEALMKEFVNNYQKSLKLLREIGAPKRKTSKRKAQAK